MNLLTAGPLKEIDDTADTRRSEDHDQELHRVVEGRKRVHASSLELAGERTAGGIENAGIGAVAIAMEFGQSIRQTLPVINAENRVCRHAAPLPR
jgi:hypothetical protein